MLDNCEHVLDVAADLTEAILRGCEHVRVLATSREGLGIDGEQLRPIRSLPVPELSTAAAVLSTDATTLFAERAAAVAPTFQHRRDQRARPWSRSAAGSTASRSPSSSRPPASPASNRPRSPHSSTSASGCSPGAAAAAVERHQTLRATVDWSYSLLRDVERTVFDRLGDVRRIVRRHGRAVGRCRRRRRSVRRARRARRAGRQVDARRRGDSRRHHALPAPRDAAAVRARTPRTSGRGRRVPASSRRALRDRDRRVGSRGPRTRRDTRSPRVSIARPTTCGPRSTGRSTPGNRSWSAA